MPPKRHRGGFRGSCGGGPTNTKVLSAGDIVMIALWEGKKWVPGTLKWWRAKLLRPHPNKSHVCWVVEWLDVAKGDPDKVGFFYPISGPGQEGADEWMSLADWNRQEEEKINNKEEQTINNKEEQQQQTTTTTTTKKKKVTVSEKVTVSLQQQQEKKKVYDTSKCVEVD